MHKDTLLDFIANPSKLNIKPSFVNLTSEKIDDLRTVSFTKTTITKQELTSDVFETYHVITYDSMIMDPYNVANIAAVINNTMYVSDSVYQSLKDHQAVTVSVVEFKDGAQFTDQRVDQQNIPLVAKSVTGQFVCNVGVDSDRVHTVSYKYCNIKRELFDDVEIPLVFEYNNDQYLIDRDPLTKLETDDRQSYTSWDDHIKLINNNGIEPIKLQLININDGYHLRLCCNNIDNYLNWMYARISNAEYIPVIIFITDLRIKTELYPNNPIDHSRLNEVLNPEISILL